MNTLLSVGNNINSRSEVKAIMKEVKEIMAKFAIDAKESVYEPLVTALDDPNPKLHGRINHCHTVVEIRKGLDNRTYSSTLAHELTHALQTSVVDETQAYASRITEIEAHMVGAYVLYHDKKWYQTITSIFGLIKATRFIARYMEPWTEFRKLLTLLP